MGRAATSTPPILVITALASLEAVLLVEPDEREEYRPRRLARAHCG